MVEFLIRAVTCNKQVLLEDKIMLEKIKLNYQKLELIKVIVVSQAIQAL